MTIHQSAKGFLALSEDRIRAIAPSVFALDKHSSRSDRFQPIPTIEIVRALQKEGFEPTFATQSGTRDESRREFTKHLLRFRPIGRFDKQLQVGDTFTEIVLKNGNDGTCAYSLMAGLFRLACLNGMVAQTQNVDEIKVRHTGKDVVGEVIEGTFRVLGESEKLLAAPADWSRIQLGAEERQILAESARVLRLGDEEGNVDSPIRADQFLAPRRYDDKARDLWTTFNVVQENSLRGGLSARAPATQDARGYRQRGRLVTTRDVNGIDQNIKLNKALWMLGERMAELTRSRAA